MKQLGWTPKPDDDRVLASVALATLVEAGNDLAVSREARKLLERDMTGKGALDPTMRKTAISLAAAAGDAKLYDAYLKTMKTVKTPDEYYNFFYGLAAFRDPALIRRTLDFALSPEVKNQDAGGLIARVFCDRDSAARVKAFFDAHPVPSAARRNAQSIERIGQCAALRELQSPQLHQWVTAHQPKTPPVQKKEM